MNGLKKFANLSVKSFNEILLSTVPDETRCELLKHEIMLAYEVKVQAMEELVYLLNDKQPYEDKLKEVNIIDSNCDVLQDMLKEQQKKVVRNHERT